MMKIQEQDSFHGAALTQIVEYHSFKALNKANEKYGHYLINADRHIFIKYCKNVNSPWSFTFHPEDLRAIKSEISSGARVFIGLVCGGKTVCALNQVELSLIIELNSSSSQWIRIMVPPRGSCHVSGSIGEMQKTIPHNSFPGKIFI